MNQGKGICRIPSAFVGSVTGVGTGNTCGAGESSGPSLNCTRRRYFRGVGNWIKCATALVIAARSGSAQTTTTPQIEESVLPIGVRFLTQVVLPVNASNPTVFSVVGRPFAVYRNGIRITPAEYRFDGKVLTIAQAVAGDTILVDEVSQ